MYKHVGLGFQVWGFELDSVEVSTKISLLLHIFNDRMTIKFMFIGILHSLIR